MHGCQDHDLRKYHLLYGCYEHRSVTLSKASAQATIVQYLTYSVVPPNTTANLQRIGVHHVNELSVQVHSPSQLSLRVHYQQTCISMQKYVPRISLCLAFWSFPPFSLSP